MANGKINPKQIDGLVSIEKGGTNNSLFNQNEILIFGTNSINSSGYLFNDSGTSSTTVWSADKIIQYVLASINSQSNALYTWTNTSTFTQGQKFIWQSPHGDLRSYVVRNGQTLNPGETPFTHPQKIQRIDGDKIVNAQTSILRVFSNELNSQKVVIRQSDGKIFATNINTMYNHRVFIRNFDSITFASNTTTVISIGSPIIDMIYIQSLDEVWVCSNNIYITRINANTNTVIGGINSFSAAPSGKVLEMFDSSDNFVYVHYLDGTNKIARINKTTLTTTVIITGTSNNNYVNGVYYEAGRCIYAMNPSDRFIIYDLNNFTETIIYDSLNLTGGTISSEIVDNKLYLGVYRDFIAVYDITNPTSPVILNQKIGILQARALKYNPKTNNLYVLTSAPLNEDGTYISVVDLKRNKVVDSHIIDDNYNTSIFLYSIAIHDLGNFIAVPYVAGTSNQGNKIFIF